MRRMLFGALMVSAAACSSVAPVKIDNGEVCYRCRRVIVESRLAAETIDRSLVSKFRTSGCLAKYLAQHPSDTSIVFVTDYKTGRLVAPSRAHFVPTVNRDNGEHDYVAYTDRAAADAEAFAHGVRAVTWDAVLDDARAWARQQAAGN
jgi:hypothetical protein